MNLSNTIAADCACSYKYMSSILSALPTRRPLPASNSVYNGRPERPLPGQIFQPFRSSLKKGAWIPCNPMAMGKAASARPTSVMVSASKKKNRYDLYAIPSSTTPRMTLSSSPEAPGRATKIGSPGECPRGPHRMSALRVSMSVLTSESAIALGP